MKAISLLILLSVSTAFAEDDFYVFPMGVVQKIAAAQDTSKVKAVVCNGSKPRVNPKVEFSVRYPDTAGMVLDDAANFKKKYMQSIRDYLKFYYFAGISGEVEHGEEYKAYVAAFSEPEYAHDLGLLRATYTFKLPKEAIEGVFKGYGNLNKQSFGYDYYSGKWSAKNALERRDWIWKKVFASQTSLKEAPAGDSVRFHVELDMTMFCAHGISGLDLISK